MSAFLLDANVLIALIDPAHVHHGIAQHWFDRHEKDGWATCPLVQNAVLRIVGHSSYPNSAGTPAAVAEVLKVWCKSQHHVFWQDDFSLLHSEVVDPSRLLDSAQVTDTYLLALAHKRGGQLATFDRRLITDAVRGGARALHLIH